jgi:chemotaxis protein MotB
MHKTVAPRYQKTQNNPMSIPSWHHQNTEAEASYETDRWETFADLMAGLLLFFALTLSAIMVIAAQERVKSVDQQEELNKLENAAEKRLGIRSEIVRSLKEELAGHDVEVDPTTGALRIGGKVLFEEDRSILRSEGEKVLDEILESYIAVFFEKEFDRHLSRIIVEGHTNDNGSYLYNLDLSQRRAFQVMAYLIDASAGSPYHTKLKYFLVASGRSFTDLLYANGQVGFV